MELTMDSGDLVTLELQRLFAGRHADPAEVLLRIDYRQEAKTAPFQFDMVNGKLHRSGCGSIPADCTPALYAVWAPGEELERVACHHCRPSGAEAAAMKQDSTLDVLFGLISIVDQFGSVLRERGKEYRGSAKGRKLAEDLDGMFSALDEAQRDALRVTVASLDGLVKAVEAVNRSTGQNGQSGGGLHRNGNQRKKKEGA